MMDYVGGFFDRVNNAINGVTRKVRESQYHGKVRQRGIREAQTLALLRGDERRRYEQVLRDIESNRLISIDPNTDPVDRRLAEGHANGLRTLRNQVEENVIGNHMVRPQKQSPMDMLRGKKGQTGPPPSPFGGNIYPQRSGQATAAPTKRRQRSGQSTAAPTKRRQGTTAGKTGGVAGKGKSAAGTKKSTPTRRSPTKRK